MSPVSVEEVERLSIFFLDVVYYNTAWLHRCLALVLCLPTLSIW